MLLLWSPTDSKIRIFDGGAKRADVSVFPCVVHMVSSLVCCWARHELLNGGRLKALPVMSILSSNHCLPGILL